MKEAKIRKSHNPELKAKVALEALRGVKTVNEIGMEFGVHPGQVGLWKKELQEGLPSVFQSGAKHRQDEEKAERDRARLERKVGQLVVEREFLEKKCEQLGIDLSERP